MVTYTRWALMCVGALWTCLAIGESSTSTAWNHYWELPRHFTTLKVTIPGSLFHKHQDHHDEARAMKYPQTTGVINYSKKRSHSGVEGGEQVFDTLSAVCASVSLGRHHPISTTALMRSNFLNELQTRGCFCTTKPKLVDLGPLRYPRYLTTVECTSGSCGLPGHVCEGRTIKIWVLKQKEDEDTEDRHAPLSPRAIRDSYIFEGHLITVACGCSD